MKASTKKKHQDTADALHRWALFCGLTTTVKMSAGDVDDIAQGTYAEDVREAVARLKQIADEAEILRRLALDAIEAGKRCK